MTLSEVFKGISGVVCKQLEEIVEISKKRQAEQIAAGIPAREEDPITAFIGGENAAEYMNDFATEEFINKNIRVRPTSGQTQQPDDKSNMNKTDGLGLENEDSDENFLKEADYQITQDRLEVKRAKAAYEKKKAQEAEMAAKKSNKKG